MAFFTSLKFIVAEELCQPDRIAADAMDEEQYKQVYRVMNEAPCPFEKALLSRQCQCERATKTNIAEREAVACNAASARELCVSFLSALREKSNFALNQTRTPIALPHAKAMKLQLGGLRGLRAAITTEQNAEQMIENIYGLLQQALSRYQSMEAFPYGSIMRGVVAFQNPRRRRR